MIKYLYHQVNQFGDERYHALKLEGGQIYSQWKDWEMTPSRWVPENMSQEEYMQLDSAPLKWVELMGY